MKSEIKVFFLFYLVVEQPLFRNGTWCYAKKHHSVAAAQLCYTEYGRIWMVIMLICCIFTGFQALFPHDVKADAVQACFLQLFLLPPTVQRHGCLAPLNWLQVRVRVAVVVCLYPARQPCDEAVTWPELSPRLTQMSAGMGSSLPYRCTVSLNG